MQFLLLSSALAILLVATSSAVPINIHVRLDQAARTEVELLALQMRDALPGDEIDFQRQFIPHATLYLTDFQEDQIPRVVEACDARFST